MKYCIYKDLAREWRWYLLSANHRKIAGSGEGYGNRKDCEDAIALVKASGFVQVQEC